MGSKVIAIRCTSPYMVKDHTIVKKIVFVDEAKGEHAIEKIRLAIESLHKEDLFVKGNYGITEISTLWEDK